MIAALPMYDRPETAAAHDRYWHLIAQSLQDNGIAAPTTLTRDMDVWTLWQSTQLLMAQTCGLPFRARLHDKVTLVGTPDFGLSGLPPGHYASPVVVRADDPRDDLAAFHTARLAYNEPLSQSGWAAIHATGATFGQYLQSGAHRQSAAMVATGKADIAALDVITWRDIQRYDPSVASRLRVLMQTDPTPGLPYITAPNRDPTLIAGAIAQAIAALSGADRNTLGLRGLVQISARDYLAIPIPPAPPTD